MVYNECVGFQLRLHLSVVGVSTQSTVKFVKKKKRQKITNFNIECF